MEAAPPQAGPPLPLLALVTAYETVLRSVSKGCILPAAMSSACLGLEAVCRASLPPCGPSPRHATAGAIPKGFGFHLQARISVISTSPQGVFFPNY